MARKPRIHCPGGVYHVTLVGNGGQQIFFSPDDSKQFYYLLAEGVRRYGYRVHAFCLITTHAHLLLQIAEIPLAKAIHNLSFRYTQWINQRQRRRGHLFQGRYKAILIEVNQLPELIRLIHFDPVRAKLVNHPKEYRWSSQRAYLGQENLSWLTTEGITGNQSNYIAKKTIVSMTLSQLVEIVCRHYGQEVAQLQSLSRERVFAKTRALIAGLAQEGKICTLTAVANYFNRDVTGLIRSLRRMANEAEAIKEFNQLRLRLQQPASEVE